MSFKILPVGSSQTVQSFLPKFEFSDDVERSYARSIIKSSRRNQSRIYILQKDNELICHGFVALSFSSLNAVPALKIDYLFTSKRSHIDGLGGMRVSEYLVTAAVNFAREINDTYVPVKRIILEAANRQLFDHYQTLGFEKIKDLWMYSSI